MRRIAGLALLVILLSGCSVGKLSVGGFLAAPTATSTPTATPTASPVPTTTHVAPKATPRPTPTPTISPAYAAFVHTICRALAARDAGTIINSLAYYQYNNGLRYGNMGDGEGQTGDPSLMNTWLAHAHARCMYFTPDQAGHGVLLTGGWAAPNLPSSLIELDIFNGHWKINDFTFGSQGALYTAVQTSGPILSYRG